MTGSGAVLHRDYETRSTVDLKKCGAHVYAEHPTTDVICAVFILEMPSGSKGVFKWRPGRKIPSIVADHIRAGEAVEGHNAAFEAAIDRGVMGPRYGWPVPALEQLHCTMARCAVQALPLDLARACAALGLTHQKDETGHKLMLKMCKPRKPRKDEDPNATTWHESPEDIDRLELYCERDVLAEIGLGQALRPMTADERTVWLLDQRINNRGVQIDSAFVETAQAAAERAAIRLDARMCETTDGAVEKATQVDRLKDYVKSHGVELKVETKTRRNGDEYEAEIADKEAIEDLLALPDLPAPARAALEIRLDAGKSSVKKLIKFKAQQCSDGRARGNLQYHGAAPGRWAGRGIQLQNLPRKGLDGKGEKALGGWEGAFRDLRELGDDTLELVWGSTPDMLSRMLRGAVVAKPGHKLVFADYSNVEARGCAWASGQRDMVELFASGGKIYEEMGASIFSLTWDEVLRLHETKENILPRFVGKETVLGCGYGMGPSAFQRNVKKKGKIILPMEICEKGVYGWRERNWRNVEFWRELEDAAKAAIENPGQIFKAGPFSYRVKGRWLQCRLPSGRVLWYRRPSLEPKSDDLEQLDAGESVPRYRWAIHYWTVNGVTKQWCKTSTWGGKLLQNNIEGICRDFMAGGMLRLESNEPRPYPIVLSVHDEAISEVPDDPAWSADEFKDLFAQVPPWAQGFPLKAEAGEGYRYAKA